MADDPGSTSAKPPTLSRRMRAALAADGPPFGHPRPNKRELAAIRAIVEARGKGYDGIALGRAIRVLADADSREETARAIAAVMNDSRADASVRHQAAAVLGEVPERVAARALVRALKNADQPMEFAALASLAKIGDARSADSIAALPHAPSAALQRARDFARAAIGIREGTASDDIADALVPVGTPVEVARVDAQQVGTALAALRGSRYGIELNPSLGYRFDCGGRSHIVFLNADLREGRLVAAPRERQMIAGVIAAREDGADHYVTRQVIFTRPRTDDGGIDVSVADQTGAIAFLGTLHPVASGLVLSLTDHVRERFPTRAEGMVTDHDIAVSATVFDHRARPQDPGEVDIVES